MKKLIFIIFILFINFEGISQTLMANGEYKEDDSGELLPPDTTQGLMAGVNCLNNGINVTVTGDNVGAYLPNQSTTFCAPSASYVGNGAWTSSSIGRVIYKFNQPIMSATITYSSVNANYHGNTDVGQIFIDGGGTLSLVNPCGVSVAGDVLTCNLTDSWGSWSDTFGDVTITVNSTCPFTEITLRNIGGHSGWVQGNACNFVLQKYSCATAPLLSSSTLSNVCPATTVNLTNITASNLISCNSILTWHTATPATSANTVLDLTAVPVGTYYASFYNQSINCYSATTPLVVAITNCCQPTLTTSVPISTMIHEERSDWIKTSDLVSFGDGVQGNGVVYHAGNFVELNPGFEAIYTSQFSAYIEGCSGDFVYKNGDNSVKEEINQIDLIKNKITIYPNPTNSLINVSYSNSKFNQVKITSMEGRVVYNQKMEATNSYQFDISGFKNGIYTLSILTVDGTILTEKLIKN
ncbi:Por secretion system C-terminal sorting domain-containing protein [Flavobacterium swingsii]|uniref:Por secretion system C-terminal sorting domain-containing protein n=1 Tax=Flavobacterium swingsii TaxID=498292 RepID=A0A1I0Z3M4_9FLAO|nr:T9SS type A sorting domain-containing protein [Flavobacterium swingsii]SFB20339.1 Por secretion system C-terminal sorting domain-containing protein [Flavobacterium swingsii]